VGGFGKTRSFGKKGNRERLEGAKVTMGKSGKKKRSLSAASEKEDSGEDSFVGKKKGAKGRVGGSLRRLSLIKGRKEEGPSLVFQEGCAEDIEPDRVERGGRSRKRPRGRKVGFRGKGPVSRQRGGRF